MLVKTSRTIALCSLANFINAADRIIMPIAIIPLADIYNWSLYWQGWILSAFAFGYITSQILGATASSRFGGKSVMALAVFLWSLSTLITPLVVSSMPLLIICRIVLGLGEGFGLPTVYHIFAHEVPVEERSRGVGYLMAAGTIGQALTALIGLHMPWQFLFYMFGTLGLCWVFAWLCLYQEPAVSTKEDQLPLVFPKVTKINVRWPEFICHWSLWAIYIAHFAMNWSNYIIMQWLPTYLARSLDADKDAISLTAMPYIINSLCGVVSGHFADSLISRRWSVLSVRRLMTTLGLIGPGIFLLCFCAVNNLLAAVLFVSLSMGLCACNSAGHLSNHADVAPNHAGITFAISNMLATIPGILCGPVTAELVVQSHGRWFPVFVLAAGINIAGAVVYASQSSASQSL